MSLLPADVQQRADAELGAAFRRVQAALPKGWRFVWLRHDGFATEWTASAEPTPAYRHRKVYGTPTTTWLGIGRGGATPTEALEALLTALEERS